MITQPHLQNGRKEQRICDGGTHRFIIDQEDGQELLIPAIPDVILKIDLENNRMEVHLLEGLRG